MNRRQTYKDWNSIPIKDTTKMYLDDLSLNNLSMNGISALDLKELREKKFPFEAQQQNINNFLAWADQISDSSFLNNSIEQQKNLLFHKVSLSPDGNKMAALDSIANCVNIYSLSGNEKKPLCRKFLDKNNCLNISFSFNSEKIAILSGQGKRLAQFDANNFYLDQILEFQVPIQEFKYSKSEEETFLFLFKESIEVHCSQKITQKKISANCVDFCKDRKNLICYANSQDLAIWNFSSDVVLRSIKIENGLNPQILRFSDSGLKIITGCDYGAIVSYEFKDANQKSEAQLYNENFQKTELHESELNKTSLFLISSSGQFLYLLNCKEGEIFSCNSEKDDFFERIKKFDFPIADAILFEDKLKAVNDSNNLFCVDPQLLKSNTFDLPNHYDIIISFSSDCEFFASKSESNTKLMVFETSSRKLIKDLLFETEDEVEIKFSQNASYLVVTDKKKFCLLNLSLLSKPIIGPIELTGNSAANVFLVMNNGDAIFALKNGDILNYSSKKQAFQTLQKVHDSTITAINVNGDEDFWATGDHQGEVCVWDSNRTQSQVIPKDESEVCGLVFGFNEKTIFIAYTKAIKIIKIWNMEKSEVLETIANISVEPGVILKVSENNNNLLIAQEFRLWVFSKIHKTFLSVLSEYEFEEKILDFSFDKKAEFSFIMKNRFGVYKVSNLIKKESVEFSGLEVLRMTNEMIMLMASENKANKVVFLPRGQRSQSVDFHKKITAPSRSVLIASFDGSQILVLNDKNKNHYFLWKVNSDKCDELFTKESIKTAVWTYSPEGNDPKNQKMVAFTARENNMFRIHLWPDNSSNPFDPQFTVYNWELEISAMAFSFETETLLVACKDELRVLDLANRNHQSPSKQNIAEVISSLKIDWGAVIKDIAFPKIKNENKIIVLLSKEQYFIHIYNDRLKNVQIFQLSSESTSMIFDPTFDDLLLFDSKYISSFNLHSEIENKIFEISKGRIKKIFVNSQNDLLIVSQDKSQNIVGSYKNYRKNSELFLKSTKTLLELAVSPQLDKNDLSVFSLETPLLKLNFLHVLAYASDSNSFLYKQTFDAIIQMKKEPKLKKELFFAKDLYQRNCFEILLCNQNVEVLNLVFEYIFVNYKIPEIESLCEDFNSRFFEEMLTLFELNPKTITKFLDYVFSHDVFSDRVLYPRLKEDFLFVLDSVKCDGNFLIEILDKDNEHFRRDSPAKTVILGKILHFPSLLDRFDPNTIEIFKKISMFEPTNAIFGNDTIIKVVQHKWDSYGKSSFFIEMFSFFCMLVIYLVNCCYFIEKRNSMDTDFGLIASIIIDIILFLMLLRQVQNEILQIRAFKASYYFKIIWNNLDLLLIISLSTSVLYDLTYCLISLSGDSIDSSPLRILHSITINICFLRAFSFARGFEGSAFVVKLIFQVIYDIRYFLILMIFFMFGLGCSTYVLQGNSDLDFITNFLLFYRETIGDLTIFDDTTEEISDSSIYFMLYILFFYSTIILSIILLNLLISILGDTFGKVKAAENRTKIWEKFNIITEIDILAAKSANPLDRKKEYLYFIYNEKVEDLEEDLVKKNVLEIKEREEKMEDLVKKNVLEIKEREEKIIKLLEELKTLKQKE